MKPTFDSLRALKNYKEPIIHELNDEEGLYYMEQNLTTQGMKDLYAYAAMHGPFMMSELGFLAHQTAWSNQYGQIQLTASRPVPYKI